MTGTDHGTTADCLGSTSWLLRRFTSDGVTASLSQDLRVCLRIDDDHGVLLSSGLLLGTGRIRQAAAEVDFAVDPREGLDATPPDSLERRAFAAIAGPFEVRREGPLLHLRQGSTSMDLVALPD